MQTKPNDPLREVRITAVENGFILVPRHFLFREGDYTGCFVFSTVAEMAGWMMRQPWAVPSGEKA